MAKTIEVTTVSDYGVFCKENIFKDKIISIIGDYKILVFFEGIYPVNCQLTRIELIDSRSLHCTESVTGVLNMVNN